MFAPAAASLSAPSPHVAPARRTARLHKRPLFFDEQISTDEQVPCDEKLVAPLTARKTAKRQKPLQRGPRAAATPARHGTSQVPVQQEESNHVAIGWLNDALLSTRYNKIGTAKRTLAHFRCPHVDCAVECKSASSLRSHFDDEHKQFSLPRVAARGVWRELVGP